MDFDYLKPDYQLPIETRLTRRLRIWGNTQTAECEQEIRSLLEFFICECVKYDPAGRITHWCADGVVELKIEQRTPLDFKLAGVTWIGIGGLVPFDINARMHPEFDEHLSRCLFRIAHVDQTGRPVIYKPGTIIDSRHRPDCEWAMAVELSPSETAEK